MTNTHALLPKLTVNRSFIEELMNASPPCFALGYVEDRGTITGFIAMRPDETIPSHSTQQGFNFGHSVMGSEEKPCLHFAFNFYGHMTYSGLVQPCNIIAQSVIETMLETKDYFFFAINPDQSVTAFRSQLEDANLSGLKTNMEKFKDINYTEKEYETLVDRFSKNPDPKGKAMKWVCRDRGFSNIPSF
jgi:hypothetical protein